ncbi:MAG: class I SAM-dependent rRNA methyltransferase [Alphaproteobacteria bacterium]|nr:class I SAM-dependent rRNA methyltransferase [Alphaproteobacteria bacterium]
MASVAPPTDDPLLRPAIKVGPGMSRRWRRGHPWLFSNEIEMTAQAKELPRGTLVTVVDAGGERLGVGTFNAHSLIAVRLLSRDSATVVDAGFLALRLRAALALREIVVAAPCYRLVHSEADGLPGLVIDRFGDVVSCQVNSAGMERLLPALLTAIEAVLAPRAVVLDNDTPVRELEGLDSYHRVATGELNGPVELVENGVRFLADLDGGQKTGWFYDQRDNRAFVARLARGQRVADFFSYAGGFAIQAAAAGASEVTLVDRSEAALALAEQAAALNGVAPVCRFVRAEAFAEMARRVAAGERFGVVVCDPPAFVKSRKDLATGLKGYRKMARLAAALVAPGGFLFAASCSHHVTADAFAEEITRGVALADRGCRIMRAAGAAPDHPLHPALPESAYLKALVLHLD